MMKPSVFSLLIVPFILACNVTASTNPVRQAQGKPNVILLVTDDQGYGDLSCHGNPVINTPNMDALHAESVRFTNFHVDPTCAPTRSALMTGKYSHHVGVWSTVCGGNHLRASEITMADVFKQAGYRTGAFGKWHLGSNYPYRPMDRGFDEWIGQGDGGTGTTDDWYDNDRVNDYYWHNGERVQRDGFAPDVFFEAAEAFIQESAANNEPFFAYVATYLPHDPHTLPDRSMIDKYDGKISDYVAHFFASIEHVDGNIGKLRQVLEQAGVAENTIFVFMTDNGGTAGVRLFNAGMRGHKAQAYDGGHRVPLFIHWPAGDLQHGTDVNDLSAHIDLLPTLIDLCGIELDATEQQPDFDGRSFKKQLFDPTLELPKRILFVENQRTYKAQKWHKTAGMTNRWRLVDNKELYDMLADPGQQENVIKKYPEVVQQICDAHQQYWKCVTPHDRESPRFIVGDPAQKEIYLTTSDWYLPKEPAWNHAKIGEGTANVGEWNLTIAATGTYRFEVRRWPREADAGIQGVPEFNGKEIDAWLSDRPVDRFIYGSEVNALPVHSIRVQVGDQIKTGTVSPESKEVGFEFELRAGDTEVTGQMLDEAGEEIGGLYYVYITKVSS